MCARCAMALLTLLVASSTSTAQAEPFVSKPSAALEPMQPTEPLDAEAPLAAPQHTKSPVLRNLLISAAVIGGLGLLLSAALHLDERRRTPPPRRPAPPRSHDVS